jgi:hypothetical protein
VCFLVIAVVGINYMLYFSDLPPGVYEHDLKQYNAERWDGPVYSTMNTAKSRLATYKTWPSDAVKTPEELAYAGFFYRGAYLLVSRRY